MTHIIFFEKPGCGGNARQRDALLAAGHTLTQQSLLTTAWTADSLMPFLGPLPVPQWFNRAAPAVKIGAVQPHQVDADEALALLLAQPLLIRRPLMQRTDLPGTHPSARHVGFETAAVHAWVGLAHTGEGAAARPSLEGCVGGSATRAAEAHHCHTPSTGD